MREHLPGSHINMNMQVSNFFNTLAFLLLFTVSAQAQANHEEFRIFEIELLSPDLIQDNYADTLAFGKKPNHPAAIPCDCDNCDQKRVPGIIKGSTMKDIMKTVEDITDFINSKFE